MHKNTIAIIFSFLFIALISAPTIVIVLDDSASISMFYSTSEEEKGSEKTKEHKVVFYNFNTGDLIFTSLKMERNPEYFVINYSKPYSNIISPPPEYCKL